MHRQTFPSKHEISRRAEPVRYRDNNEPGNFAPVVGFVAGAIDQHPDPEYGQRQNQERKKHKPAEDRCKF